jgi:hypothetical protein
MRSIRAAAVAVVMGIGALAVAPPASAQSDPRSEAEWAALTQVPHGASLPLASHADHTFVNPYLAAFGAIGLAEATRVTSDPRYAEAAWRQAEWHASVMDAAGYVTDYHVVPGGLASTGSADSTDAYAAMFVLNVEAAYRAAPNGLRLGALAPKLRLAVAAMRSTQRTDGLTGAKPDWNVAYLMNDAEVFAGLNAAARLGSVLRDRQLVAVASDAARRLQKGFDRLWNPSTGAYDWAVHGDGARQPTNWGQLYPDAMSQVWAVRYGLVRGPRAVALLRTFLATHPNAHDPNASDLIDGSVRPTGYWPGLGLALVWADRAAPARFLAGTRAAAAGTGLAWPYSVQTAGDVLALIALGA